ncbi:MAG: glutaryl-CoA dehydrogenase Acd [Pseudomonadota bacterium]
MNFDLTEEQLMMRQLARDFALKEIKPVVDKDEASHRFQSELVKKMGELGFFGCIIPEEYGGSNTGFVTHALITEEIARVSGSLRAPFNAQAMGTAREIFQYGNEEQRKKYIPRLVSAEWLGCICITEPNAGSDVASMRTKAVRHGDHYLINGSKNWITYGEVADIGIVYAYTDQEKKHNGISAFIVDMHSAGISTASMGEKMGWNACPTSEVFFEEVKVPGENLMGNAGEGFKYCMGGLDNTRLSAAAGAVGVAQGLLDESIRYATEREQFGKPIAQFQMVQEVIARMATDIDAARLLTYRCAYLKDKGVPSTVETSMAKLFSCEVASRVSDLALQVLGAYGYSREYPVERYLRDAKLYQLLEGSVNIQKVIIAGDVLGIRPTKKKN